MNHTPPNLHRAAADGNLVLLQQLLAAGTPPDTRSQQEDTAGQTPLMAALCNNHAHAARLLLEAGASPTATIPGTSISVCDCARGYGRQDCHLPLLIEHGLPVNSRSHFGETMLMLAVQEQDSPALTRYLLERGADVHARDDKQCTALLYACHGEADDTVRLLCQWGADINAQDETGTSALLSVTYQLGNDWHLLQSDDEDIDYFGDARRDLCDYPATLARLRLLLSCGANANQADNRGWTPLLIALASGRRAAAELLLAHGATLAGASEHRIRSARLFAQLRNYAETVNLLDSLCPHSLAPAEAPTLSAARHRKYFIGRDEHQGTAYVCFQRGSLGEWRFCWEEELDAPCIGDEDIYTSGLHHLFSEFFPNYSRYENFRITPALWKKIRARAKEHGRRRQHAIEELHPWVEQCFQQGERSILHLGV